MRRPFVEHSPHVHNAQYSQKRQRRQAAASVVQTLWSKSPGRKSTAQPRPALQIPPKGIGPIVDPNENDVLCGRGGRINSHAGNIQFREIIQSHKKEYLAKTTKKLEKAHIAAKIVNEIRTMEPQGRFLKEERDGLWFDIGDAKAIKKAGQALREDAPDIRVDIDEDSSGDEKNDSGDDSKHSPKSDKPAKASTDPEKSEKKTDKTTPELKKVPIKEEDNNKMTAPPATSASSSPPRHQQTNPMARQGHVSGRGPQHLPVRTGPFGTHGNYPVMTPHDYQAQVSMPPPYALPMNTYGGHGQPIPGLMQPIATQSIPISGPHPSGYMPNQVYSAAASISRQAQEALAQTQQLWHGQYQRSSVPPDDIAFGRAYHPPSSSVLSADNTMSTISALSDTMSSGIGMDIGSGFGPGGAGSSRSSNMMAANARFNQMFPVNGLSRSQLDNSGVMNSGRFSDVSGSFRSSGSFARSLSFPDMNSITQHESWRAIMEGDEEVVSHGLSSNSSGKYSVSSKNSLGRGDPMVSSNRGRTTSATSGMSLSVASMSIGSGSTSQWLANMASGPQTMTMDDGRSMLSGSILSDVSSDLHALDLADPRF